MADPVVAGLDPSLTESGLAVGGVVTTWKPPRSSNRGMKRLAWFRERARELVEVSAPDLVVIEGYSYGSRHSHAHGLGELGGVLRLAFWDAGVPYLDVPPNSLKKYASGKGNAKKELVLVEAVKRLDYPGANDNEADALWLRALGYEYLGEPIVELPKVHLKAMEKISEPVTR